MKEDLGNVILFPTLENGFQATPLVDFLIFPANTGIGGIQNDVYLV
ncbi:hypothetical protein MTY_0324 [Moorella thermoacetica Y72]|uniref:Uncharacterized protein n=1 Tax=Moorella thermoacetica Y72 TaxID=1325331 RepID=A0A0S6U9R9_NEOTH|nr:hypothetical protein MTY_0324 [Moorella thermoacetica Y72]